ncbi:MAG: hypothetical protein IJQ39_14125 [Thermoguttaceae bacterium]|nr:hypothetical protein [Thermoguttaceae bacterium]
MADDLKYEIDETYGASCSYTQNDGDVWTVPFRINFYDKNVESTVEAAWRLLFQYIRENKPKYNDHFWESIQIDEQESVSTYTASVKYSKKGDNREAEETSPNNPERARLSWSTKGGTGKRSYSKETVRSKASSYAGGYDAPNQQGGINVKNGTVEPVDVVAPAMHVTLTCKLPWYVVNDNFIRSFYDLTGTVNSDALWWFQPGELLFKGVNGDPEDKVNAATGSVMRWYNLNFEFEGMPNIGQYDERGDVPPFGIVPKDGWDYLWILREDRKDPTDNKVRSKPIAVYVERVYDRKSFAVFDALLKRA